MSANQKPLFQSSTFRADWLVQLQHLNGEFIDSQDRLHWMIYSRKTAFPECYMTEEVAQYYHLDLQDSDMVMAMVTLAEKLCDWPMAIYLRRQQQLHKPQLANQNALTWALYQQGLWQQASENIRSVMLQHYQQQQIAIDYWQLQQQINGLPYPLEALRDGELNLSPLDEHHLDGFSWVYDDPKIAELCNLPQFQNQQQWCDWLYQNQSLANKKVFAINHNEWGFIGSISLEIFAGIGFFYYWLGVDFQRQGYGSRALQLILQLGADYLGLDCCFAKVYTNNIGSQKAMEKVGFQRLPIIPEPDPLAEFFYYWGPAMPERECCRQLQWLLMQQDPDSTLAHTLALRELVI